MRKRSKNAAAVKLANLRARKLSPERRKEISEMGASKGGQARAQKLNDQRRSEIAKNAAAARWGGVAAGPTKRPRKTPKN